MNTAERLNAKRSLVAARIKALADTGKIQLLVGMLDEWKLDLILLGFGDGHVVTDDEA